MRHAIILILISLTIFSCSQSSNNITTREFVDMNENKNSLDSLSMNNLLSYSWDLYRSGSLDSALIVFSKIITIDSSILGPFDNRAIIYLKQKKYDLALKDINYVLDRTDSNDFSLTTRMDIYIGQKKYDLALLDFSKIVELMDTSELDNRIASHVYSQKAECERQEGYYEASINDANIAIKLDPNSYVAYYKRAMVYLVLGKIDLACNDLKKSKKLGNEDIPIELLNQCDD